MMYIYSTLNETVFYFLFIIKSKFHHQTRKIYNLIYNSNKYFINIPEILIFTENYEKGVILSVADNGFGIS